MVELYSNEYKCSIEWNSESNIPNINPIINNLNHQKLFVGPIESNSDNNNSDSYYLSSRNGVSFYSLFSNISCNYKLQFVSCVNEYNTLYFKLEGIRKWINAPNAFGLKRGQWADDASMGGIMDIIMHLEMIQIIVVNRVLH